MNNATTIPSPIFSPAEIVTFNNILIGVASTLSSMYISNRLPTNATMGMKSIILRTLPAIIGIIVMTYILTHYTTPTGVD